MKIVEEFVKLGYNLSLNGDRLHVIYKGSKELPEDKIQALMSELAANKQKVIEYLNNYQIVEVSLNADDSMEKQVEYCEFIASLGFKRLRVDAYTKSRKIVLVGIQKIWQVLDVECEENEQMENNPNV